MSNPDVGEPAGNVNPDIMRIGARLKRAMPELEYYRRAKEVLHKHGATRFDNVPVDQQAETLVDLRLTLADYLVQEYFAIFPCKPELKTPWTTHAHHDASADPAQIARWVREKPNCNWGRPLCAIDVDTAKAHGKDGLGNWKAILAEFNDGDEPQTKRVKTPTGGLHYHVRAPLPKCDLRPGVEIPNYVILPGSHVTANGDSVKVTGFYTLDNNLPIIDLPFIRKAMPGASTADNDNDNGAPASDLDTDAAIEQAIALLKGYATSPVKRSKSGAQYMGPAIQGDHGDIWTVQVANEVGDLGISCELCFELMRDYFNDACIPPWPLDGQQSLRTKVESAYKSRQSPLGSKSAQADFGDDEEPEDFGEDIPRDEPKDDRPFPEPLPLDMLLGGQWPEIEYTVEGLIMEGVVNTFNADGGTGKTTVSTQFGCAIKYGLPIFGRKTKQRPVLLCLGEDGEWITQRRVQAQLDTLQVFDDEFGAINKPPLNDPPLITWCLLGHDMTLAKISDQGVIKEMPFLKRLEDQLTKLGPGAFVVLDSLIDIVQMNMIEPMAVNAFFKRLLTGLCQRHRCTILVLAHPSKASMQDGSWVHGSLAMKNAVRNSIAMRKIDGQQYRLLWSLKHNYGGEDELRMYFEKPLFTLTKPSDSANPTVRRETAILEYIIGLIRDGSTPVVHTNQAVGETPREIAKRLNDTGAMKPEVTWKDVQSVMMSARRNGVLRYVEGTGHIKAHYELAGDPDADAKPEDFE
ncbi:MAG: AAA family ATPase [Candidatus Binataceae bacterium]